MTLYQKKLKRRKKKRKRLHPSSRIRTSGLWISAYLYSPPLYQLSYRRRLSTATGMNVFNECEHPLSFSAGTSRSLDHSARFSNTQPGLDTLEESADKRRFFDELEQGRDTPPDYSQLNRELGETGKSSLLSTIR